MATATEYVERLRLAELQNALAWLDGRQKILEIGAGTGWQARQLSQRGHDVHAVDLADSPYYSQRIWPIQNYDGTHLPYADNSFDVIFSSNVLEHVEQLADLLEESVRVAKPGGYLIHVVPSTSWRFWTALTYYPDLLRRAMRILLMGLDGRKGVSIPATTGTERPHGSKTLLLQRFLQALSPPAHGLMGTAWDELWQFRRKAWLRTVDKPELECTRTFPAGLFYSGSILFGPSIPIPMRVWLARVLGSSCHILVFRKRSS